MTRPVVVEHSFGDPGSGGPVTTLGRVLASELSRKYDFVRMHQDGAAGGIDPALIRRWTALLRRVRPDLVHVRGLGNEGFHGALAARLAGCPRVLLSIHGTVRDLRGSSNGWRRRVLVHVSEPATLRLATHVVTVCRSASRRAFLDPYRHKLVGEIPNGVDLHQAAPDARLRLRADLGVHSDSLVLVTVGRLSTEKGHLVLAEALRRLPRRLPRMTLLLVGDGPDRDVIERTYRGVPGAEVLVLGRRLDVPALLHAADLFVFPTLHENLSNALLEAMAAGLPVVATSVGGNVEVLERGGGVLVPASEPAALAAAITRLATDRALRDRYGAEARSVVEAGYTIDHMVSRVDDVYQAILRGGARGFARRDAARLHSP